MASHAARHFLRVAAAQEAAAMADPGAGRGRHTQYELALAQLAVHRRRLHDIQSIERRAEVKRQLIPEYDPYLEGVLVAGSGQQDDVLATLLVWKIDAGDIPGALTLADYVLAHDLRLPEQFKRDPATLIAEEVADAALKPGSLVPLAELSETESLTRGHDMPDEVRAKLHRALGLAMEAAGLPDQSLAHLNRALTLHEKVGAKKDIERLTRALRK